jgi:hypothetical protein
VSSTLVFGSVLLSINHFVIAVRSSERERGEREEEECRERVGTHVRIANNNDSGQVKRRQALQAMLTSVSTLGDHDGISHDILPYTS